MVTVAGRAPQKQRNHEPMFNIHALVGQMLAQANRYPHILVRMQGIEDAPEATNVC
jgi:hypothetical protein